MNVAGHSSVLSELCMQGATIKRIFWFCPYYKEEVNL